jgi:hypothetical protein
MTEPAIPQGLRRDLLTPFVVFGVVALAAAGGALYEISYYAGQSALSGQALGTTVGIVIALVAFFAIGLRAPRNE